MIQKIKIEEKEFNLEEKDIALILTLNKLTKQIERLANNGR